MPLECTGGPAVAGGPVVVEGPVLKIGPATDSNFEKKLVSSFDLTYTGGDGITSCTKCGKKVDKHCAVI